jgi:hypothetical protein
MGASEGQLVEALGIVRGEVHGDVFGASRVLRDAGIDPHAVWRGSRPVPPGQTRFFGVRSREPVEGGARG